MRTRWTLFFLLLACLLKAQTEPTAQVTVITIPQGHWKASDVPWVDWFTKNTLVSNKETYVHYFWNAQDAKTNFQGEDRKYRLADAALELTAKLHPATAKADMVKVDIVYVLERDSYGLPSWDSLQKVAHFEFSRAKAMKALKGNTAWSEPGMKKMFSKWEFF